MAANSPPTPFPLGADLNNPDAWNATNEATFQTTYNNFVSVMGVAPSFIDSAVDYTQPVSNWIGSASEQAQSQALAASAKNMTPVIGLPMFSTAAGSASIDQQLQAFASGQYDSVIQGIVQAYTSQGYTNLNFRLGWEMNLPGTPTYVGSDAQTQADWVTAFRHIYTVLHQAAASDGATVQVIWNPGTTSDSAAEATTNLYPGNAYVDVIGADMYADMAPFADTSNPTTYHDWATGGEDTSLAQFMANPINREHYWSYPAANEWSNDGSGGHSQSLASLIQFAEQQGKPFAIPETGAGDSSENAEVLDDPAFPQWLSAQLTAAQAAGEKIDFVNLWDTNSGGGNNAFTSPSDNKPLEAAAWAKYFGAQAPAATAASLGGMTSSRATTDEAPIAPFSAVTISNSTAGQTEAVTITLSTTANGALSNLGGGTYNSSTGVYTISGTDAAVTSAVDGLVFTPTAHQVAPGSAVTTTLTMTVADTGGTATSTMTVAATAVADAPVISAAKAGQTTTDAATIKPFAAVSISDVDPGQNETVTVTLSAAANGVLSNLGTGAYNASTGTYTVSGSNTAVTSALDGLVFVPTAHQVAAGSVVQTGFTISATDTAGVTTRNSTTTVLTTALAVPSAPVMLGSGSDQLALSVAEDAWQGNAQFTVSVDGIQIGGTQTAVALNSAGQSQLFDLAGNWGDGTHKVAVDFLNDAYGGSATTDRNLYVTGATYDSVTDAADKLTLLANETQSLTVGTPAPGVTTIGSGSDLLALQVSEDYYQANAQFTVSVDGKQVGGTQTAVASHSGGQSQTFDVDGSWGLGPHTVAVDFLNDAYGGSPTLDRNLYVTGASYDGHAAPAGLTLLSDGTQTLGMVSSTTYSPAATGGTVTTLGADIVNAGSGALTVNANGPSTTVTGGSGRLTFIGSTGNDTVSGGSGDVVVNGNADTLTFNAGTGYSTITAGTGKEVYNIVNGHAGNWLKISDFTAGTDSIHLSGYTGTGVATDGTAGGSTYITLTDKTTIALVGVSVTGTQNILS